MGEHTERDARIETFQKMQQSKRRRTQTARNAPTNDPARRNSVATGKMSENVIGRERRTEKGRLELYIPSFNSLVPIFKHPYSLPKSV
jgi:hypothetical protein